MTAPSSTRPSRAKAKTKDPRGNVRAYYKALAEHAPDYLFVLDAAGRVEFANRAASPLTPAKVRGTPAAVYVGAGAAQVREALARVVATGIEETHEFPSPRQDGSQRWYCARMKRYADGGDPKVLLFVSDITERRKAESDLEESRRQMLHAQKMESIGRLAGGVAHDFNNLLTAIISFSRFVMDDLAPGDPRRADLVEVLKAADSAAKLTSQLLAFSRKRPVEPVQLDLNASVGQLGRVLRRTLEEPIALDILPCTESLQVMFDPGQLDQLLMNLAVNARDAMPEGGTLTISSARRLIHDHPQLPDGEYAALSVADSGLGMSAEVLAQIFEPFFSTKGDKGTGLGLATCYGIVKQAHGHIEVQSRPDEGSCFTVLLPLAGQGTAESSAQLEDAPARSARLDGLALVVEDQAAIRRTMIRSLQGVGLNVLEARTAEEALAIVEDLGARVDLLVTDVVLPGLNGIKLAEALRTSQPALRVLVCSGYVGADQDSEIQLEGRTAFLPKPFTGAQLASKACGLFA